MEIQNPHYNDRIDTHRAYTFDCRTEEEKNENAIQTGDAADRPGSPGASSHSGEEFEHLGNSNLVSTLASIIPH